MAKPKIGLEVVTANETDLGSRFRKLAQIINSELGFRDQRLYFTNTLERSGILLWRLANNVQASEQTPPGIAAHMAVSADGSCLLGVGFTEQWNWREKSYVFGSSNLRFSIIGEDRARPIRFRLEWAERELSADGKTWLFPGKGAAHPHWQFDGDLRLVASLDAQEPVAAGTEDSGVPVVAVPIGETIEDMTDLLSEGKSGPAVQQIDLSWFHKLHLPARAQWSDKMCSMPDDVVAQQHSPKHIDDLDRWVVSALRYLRHEFEQYSA